MEKDQPKLVTNVTKINIYKPNLVLNLGNWNLNALIGIFNVKFEIILVEIYEPLREKVERKLGKNPTKNSNYLEYDIIYWYSTNLVGIPNAKFPN